MSEPGQGFVLIAALAGRALAQAARRAGYQPLVADLFGDDDTRAAAAASVRLAGGLTGGLTLHKLAAAVAELARGRTPMGLVYGSGFEDRPALLETLAARHRLLGNAPATLRAVKRPDSLQALCATAGVPHPPPGKAAGAAGEWLEKRAGGSGGAHVRALAPGAPAARGHYAQEKLPGLPVSAVFVANGKQARVLGLCDEWADPSPEEPYRYGGAARPAALAPARAAALTEATGALAAAAGLVGLNSADFLVTEHSFVLLEINPRPSATLDLFADATGSAFRLHVESCGGALPESPGFAPAAAAAVVYATRPVVPPQHFPWPDWAADRQPAGQAVGAGAPLCTVLAEAPDAMAARTLLAQRSATLLAMMEAT